MQQPQFALQTFTIRKFMTSPAAIEAGIARVGAMGLKAIELAYIKLRPAEIDAVERACKQHGVVVGSTQITFDFLNKHRDWVLQLHEQLGCTTTSVSVMPLPAIFGKPERLLRFAEQLDALGQYYRQHGLQLCYHHHDFELRHYGNQLGLDLLLQNTAPDNVGLVLDTYWTARGGRSPQDSIRDLGSRIKIVHLRDFAVRWKPFRLAPTDAALGCGNLDITRIVESCIASNVRYMAIEQATDTPFEQVAASVAHLKTLGFNTLF